MKSKILVIGPGSTHVERFIGLVLPLFDEVVYVGESRIDENLPVRQHIINFRSVNPFGLDKTSRRLRTLIEGENPAVIHIQQVNRVAYFASRVLKRLSRKFILTAWGSDVLVIPQKNIFFRWMTKTTLRRAAWVTADSRDMLEAICRLAPGSQVDLVLFGIAPLGYTGKEKLIYSNRALFPLYNVETIVDEFIVFSRSNAGWQLVIAGTGPNELSLKEKVKQSGIRDQIKFCGWLNHDENYSYYRRSSIYISLPFSDGTSVSLLEAMSAGCIPVVSDLPVSHEWITDGINGVIRCTGENCIASAVKMNLEEVARHNEKLIAERATSEIARNKLETIYKKLIGG